MPAGATSITKVTVNGVETSDFNVDGNEGRVIVAASSDIVKVTIGGKEYTITK